MKAPVLTTSPGRWDAWLQMSGLSQGPWGSPERTARPEPAHPGASAPDNARDQDHARAFLLGKCQGSSEASLSSYPSTEGRVSDGCPAFICQYYGVGVFQRKGREALHSRAPLGNRKGVFQRRSNSDAEVGSVSSGPGCSLCPLGRSQSYTGWLCPAGSVSGISRGVVKAFKKAFENDP